MNSNLLAISNMHAEGAVPLGVTLMFSALLVGLILCLALEEKIHAKKSIIAFGLATGLKVSHYIYIMLRKKFKCLLGAKIFLQLSKVDKQHFARNSSKIHRNSSKFNKYLEIRTVFHGFSMNFRRISCEMLLVNFGEL